jgi:putative FmdB family regulatory protein
MPFYEYQARDPGQSCEVCAHPFEQLRRLADPPLTACPRCGAAIVKLISAPAVGASRSGLDQRAKQAGFHQLKRVSKGEYEKTY